MSVQNVLRTPALAVAASFALGLSAPCIATGAANEPELTLERAEERALTADPAVLGLGADAAALESLAVAAGELPDPMARLGVMSLPVDGFELEQEAMTQVVAGFVQRFPRGGTRELERRQLRERAGAVGLLATDQRLQVVRTVRDLYVDIVLQRRLQSLTETARLAFADLADITRDYYATGRARQQDVLQAAVELARIEERGVGFRQAERAARANLSAFVGDLAFGTVSEEWPELPAVPPMDELRARLEAHPRLRALHQQAVAAETGVDLADERYRPEFTVDVSYGLRSGADPQGRTRPDLFSAMVVMDLPFFHDNRQDRVRAARLSESSAAAFRRDDAFRRLRSEMDRSLLALEDVERRHSLFETVLLPQAAFSAESSYEAYQSAVGDLTSLLRARIAEYELGLDHARVQAEALGLQAYLLYLAGDRS